MAAVLSFWILYWWYDWWYSLNIWDEVFKNKPNKICESQAFKTLKWYQFKQTKFKFLNDYFLQVLPGPFLNTLSHIHDILS